MEIVSGCCKHVVLCTDRYMDSWFLDVANLWYYALIGRWMVGF